MLGLIVLTVGGLLLAAYAWLVFVTYRFVRRRTGSDVWGALSVLGILVLTVGDTVFNRWYVTNVLCQREDAGLRIIETVRLPAEHWDVVNNRPNLPSGMSVNKPFLGRYAEVTTYSPGGTRPFTAFTRYEKSVVDTTTGNLLARFVDYTPSGGLWWSFPVSLLGNSPALGWFLRASSRASCFDNPTPLVIKAVEGSFALAK